MLLIRDEAEVRQMLSFFLASHFGASVKGVATSQEALNVLLDDVAIDLIICDDNEASLRLFKYLLSTESSIPCITIQRGGRVGLPASGFHIFPDLIIGSLESLNALDDLKRMIDQGIASERIRRGGESHDGYCRIHTSLLTRVHPLNKDVFIRLSNVKYVRLFQEGDHFTAQDLEQYLVRKKIEYLYVRREDASAFTIKFRAELAEILKSKQLNAQDAGKYAAGVHEMVHELGNVLGFTDEVQQVAKQGVQLALKAIGTNPKLSQIIHAMGREKDKYISSHSMATAHVACAISASLNWPSGTTFQKLTYAAFFHDIGIRNQDLARVKGMDEFALRSANFSLDEAGAFKNHPLIGAEVIRRFSEIPPDVDLIISQHHERPDGTGFPKGLTGSYVAPLSCLFIVAHDLVDHMWDTGNAPTIEKFFEDYQLKNSLGNFRKILASLDVLRVTDGLSPKKPA